MIKMNNIKVEVIFLIFCLFFGSIFAVINPPFAASDEMWHFFKAYDISQGHLIRDSPVIEIPRNFDVIYHFTPWEASTVENYRNKDYNFFNKPLNNNDTQIIGHCKNSMEIPN
ncbi:MAG: DUF2142 domain-containing protein [Methanobrevibacter sp.]|jgi:hypothetical protein|nr:DUF2142 domain-containing protein [Methanobrevibacter sp.]